MFQFSWFNQFAVQHPVSGLVDKYETQPVFILRFQQALMDTDQALLGVGGAEDIIQFQILKRESKITGNSDRIVFLGYILLAVVIKIHLRSYFNHIRYPLFGHSHKIVAPVLRG